MYKQLRAQCILILSLCFGGTISPCSWSSSPSHWRFWNVVDGLGESYSRSLSYHPDGRLWINHGDIPYMSMFDGYQVRTYPSPGPRAPVHISATNQLWSLAENEVLLFEDGKWLRFPCPGVLLETPFYPLASNSLLLLFPQSLDVFHIGNTERVQIKKQEESNLGPFMDMLCLPDGDVWITGQKGIAKATLAADRQSLSQWIEYDSLSAGFQNLHQPFLDQDGNLHVVAEHNRSKRYCFVRFHQGEWNIIYETDQEIVRGWIDFNKNLWIQTENDLLNITGKQYESVSHVDAIQGKIYDVEIEPSGSFWIASSHGIARYAAYSWKVPEAVQSIRHNVFSIFEDRQERIWFAEDDALLLLRNGQWFFYPYPSGIHGHRYETDALSQLPNGRILLNSSRSRSLLMFDPAEEKFHLVSHPENRRLRYIAPRKDGTAWVRTRGDAENDYRLETFDGRVFTPRINLQNDPTPIRVRHVLETRNGDVWIGHLYGIALYRKGELIQFSTKEYPGLGAFCIHEIDDQTLWIGDRNQIYAYSQGKWKTLFSNLGTISAIRTSSDGSLWIASGSGLHRYKNRSLVTVSKDDGLPSSLVFNFHEDHLGRYWVGTSRGLCLYNPGMDRESPDTFILNSAEENEVSPIGNIRFFYQGIDKWKYTLSNRLMFSTRLDNGEWSPFSLRNNTSFKHLAYGNHTFEVHAMDRNRNIDSTPAVYHFSVLTPWYFRPGFLVITSLSTLLIIVLLILVIFYNLNLKNLVRERTSKLADINVSLQKEVADRKMAEEALQKSEQLFREAIEVADAVPYYRNYITNQYEFMGDGIESITGYSRKEITPEIWETITLDFFPLGELAGLSHEEAIRTARTNSNIRWRADYLIRTKNGQTRWMANAAVEVKNDEGEVVGSLGMLQDITGRKQTENALRDSESKNQALLNAIPDLIVRIKSDGTYLDYKSPRDFEPFFSASQIIGKNVKEVLPAPIANQVMYYMKKTLMTGRSEVFEYCLEHEGHQRECEARIVTSGPEEVLAIIRDISDRKRLEKEILQIREKERKRIGDELHDDLCQSLTGIALRSKVLEERLRSLSPTDTPMAKEITDWINKSISKTRMIARGLHPIALETQGLKSALDELVSNTEKMYDIQCRLHYDDRIQFADDSISNQLYRIAQEALNNAIRHGHAHHVDIELSPQNNSPQNNQYMLSVKDDGVGISESDEKSEGMGIQIMKYRSRLIHATLEIQSNNKQGTVVSCSFRSPAIQWNG